MSFNYDDWKTGLHDSDSPMNRETFKDEFIPHWDNLSEAYESGYENVFHAKRNEIINELWIVHEVLKVTGHGMKGRIECIIEKMM